MKSSLAIEPGIPLFMKRLLFILFLVIATVGAIGQRIPAAPNPPRLVNDFANILDAQQEQQLENKLVAFDDSSSIQIAVVTVNTLDGYEPVDYAVKLGRQWGVGNKKTNNGVILLVSTEEGNRRVFIAPGYGMEGAIPDIIASRIVRNDIIPYFQQGDYYQGIEAGTNSLIAAGRGEYVAPEGYANRGEETPGIFSAFFIIFLVILFIIIISNAGGGKGGGMISRRGYGDYDRPIIWFPGSSGGGRGGGFGGFGGGGGGFGGGGFGGFGGGSFGGGGAGGSW